jgi:hypothetical protein
MPNLAASLQKRRSQQAASEARALVAEAHVAAGGEIHAAADAVAGDLGDRRLGKVVERLVTLLRDRVVADLRLGIGALALELRDVGAGDECLAARAAHHQATDLWILFIVLEDGDEAIPHVERHGIELGRIVENDMADRAIASAVNLLFLHGADLR